MAALHKWFGEKKRGATIIDSSPIFMEEKKRCKKKRQPPASTPERRRSENAHVPTTSHQHKVKPAGSHRPAGSSEDRTPSKVARAPPAIRAQEEEDTTTRHPPIAKEDELASGNAGKPAVYLYGPMYGGAPQYLSHATYEPMPSVITPGTRAMKAKIEHRNKLQFSFPGTSSEIGPSYDDVCDPLKP